MCYNYKSKKQIDIHVNKPFILEHTILIQRSSRENRWKKAVTILTGFPTGPQKAITLNTKEKEACHVWHDEHKAWPQPAVPQRRPVQERPGNKQPLNYLTHTDSSSQPHIQDRRQPAMTFMTQSMRWKEKKVSILMKAEKIFFMIRVCSRTCYLDVLHVLNPFITALIWWVQHSKVEQRL